MARAARPGVLMRLLLAFVLLLTAGALQSTPRVEELRSAGGLSALIAGGFDEISACHLSPEGDFLVFDRRAHAVFSVPRNADYPKKIVQIGSEQGRILRPSAFDSAGDGTFVVADAPGDRPRFQFFYYTGMEIGGFTLSRPQAPHITLGDVVLSGIGSLEYTGRTVLISQPEVGALVTEYGSGGTTIRTFGDLRYTGQERDPEVHTALNVGMTLAIPQGGYYFVFLSGVPMFRKYDAQGQMLFERHVEGPELDQFIRTLPTTWPKRKVGGDEIPVVGATVRAAGVDADGNLWISLLVPYTYVYDSAGEKRRTIQFRAAGVMMPSGFFFTKDRRILVSPGCYLFPRP